MTSSEEKSVVRGYSRRVTRPLGDEGEVVQSKVLPTPVRVLIALGLGALGFVFPLFFIFAGLMLWSIYGDLKAPTAEPEYIDPRTLITAADPDWRAHWLVECESPAEEAFLHAVVDGFGLVPHQGQLRNADLILLLQVQIPPYRTDFMMGERLIIEVDGAAYHSSPEAIASDAERDRFLVGQGFAVLRIPAKVVLNDPSETVRRVRKAWEMLPPITGNTKPAKANPSVVGTLSTIKEKAVAFDKALAEGGRRMSAWAAQAEAEAEAGKIRQKELLEDLAKWATHPKFHEELHGRVQARLSLKWQAEESLKDYGRNPFAVHPGSEDLSEWDESLKMQERDSLIVDWKAAAAVGDLTDAEGQPLFLKAWAARATSELVHEQRLRVTELKRRVTEKERQLQGIGQEQELADTIILEMPPYELGELEFELRRFEFALDELALASQ